MYCAVRVSINDRAEKMLMLIETVENLNQIAFDSFYFVTFLRQKKNTES